MIVNMIFEVIVLGNLLYEKTLQAKKYLENIVSQKPKVGLVLGSGLGTLGDEVEDKIFIEYSNIPNFPVSTVAGHKGRFVLGKLENKDVVVMQGRFHYYEGYSMQQVVFPVLVMKALGVQKMIITNAAGGINTSYKAGDLMLIEDHINFLGNNPLIGKNIDEFGPRFPEMSNAYSKSLINMAVKLCDENKIEIKKGVYISMTGPAYETPAEIRMARILGADAVGMSTVPEVIAANHGGMEVLGISCITNIAAGVLDVPLSHAQVIETAEAAKDKFTKLVRLIIGRMNT